MGLGFGDVEGSWGDRTAPNGAPTGDLPAAEDLGGVYCTSPLREHVPTSQPVVYWLSDVFGVRGTPSASLWRSAEFGPFSSQVFRQSHGEKPSGRVFLSYNGRLMTELAF